MFDIKSAAARLLSGCVVTAQDGTRLYTPDGQGNYRALWTRDFAYMLRGAGDLIPPEDAKACIDYLLRGAREDGWIPDRVEPEGKAIYTAGDEHFPAQCNLDTGAYLVLAAGDYLSRLKEDEAKAQFAAMNDALTRGIACLPIDPATGLVVNDVTPPHSPYGFTDCVAKTGLLCMESLILWEAMKTLRHWRSRCGLDSIDLTAAMEKIEKSIESVFAHESGLLYAATGQCHQLDVWSSCYAVYLDFPLPGAQKTAISRWLAAHYAHVIQCGQLRHLPGGEYWQALFVHVPQGEYQNGAYWATPIQWLCAALAYTDESLARDTLTALLHDFEKRGIYECVNGDLLRLDTYVVSATNAYGAAKDLGLL